MISGKKGRKNSEEKREKAERNEGGDGWKEGRREGRREGRINRTPMRKCSGQFLDSEGLAVVDVMSLKELLKFRI